MPDITVLSLNMQGVDGTVLAKVVAKIKPDLVALQEAPAATHAFYGALKDNNAWISSLDPYDITGPIKEYIPRTVNGSILEAQGSMKNNVVLFRKSSMDLLVDLELVNFLDDANIPKPKDVNEARDKGFAARPPAYARFKHKPHNTKVGLFTWHAPTLNDPAHTASLKYFDKCKRLENSCTNNALTILAGDFNDAKITGYFIAFDQGIQHKFDYILADKATSHEDLSGPKSAYAKDLDGLHTSSQDHFSMCVTLKY